VEHRVDMALQRPWEEQHVRLHLSPFLPGKVLRQAVYLGSSSIPRSRSWSIAVVRGGGLQR
jgi:hypothetical protein